LSLKLWLSRRGDDAAPKAPVTSQGTRGCITFLMTNTHAKREAHQPFNLFPYLLHSLIIYLYMYLLVIIPMSIYKLSHRCIPPHEMVPSSLSDYVTCFSSNLFVTTSSPFTPPNVVLANVVAHWLIILHLLSMLPLLMIS